MLAPYPGSPAKGRTWYNLAFGLVLMLIPFNYGHHYSGKQAVHLSLTTLVGAWPASAGTRDSWTDSYSWPNS